MAAIAADRASDDTGMTVTEWAEKLGRSVEWVRREFRRLKAKGRLQRGLARRMNLRDKEFQADVYRLKK